MAPLRIAEPLRLVHHHPGRLRVRIEALLQRALALALPPAMARRQRDVAWTTTRRITRRGAIWLGQTCNLRCHFCFFIDRIEDTSHPEHEFMSLEKAKRICKTLVDVYGNNAVDIQGGEPTLWRPILPLIEYCRTIGLTPSLITNAVVLDDKKRVLEFKKAGLREFLVSVHGLGPAHDWAVGVEGAHERQMKALRNMIEVGIPFRLNTVLTRASLMHLPQIARLAALTGARVANFLTFLPFDDQATAGARTALNLPRHSEVIAPLTEALDLLAEAGVEANVRFFPLCLLPERHRQAGFNLQQLPYDEREWDLASLSWTSQQQQRTKTGEPSQPMERRRPRWLDAADRRLTAWPFLRRALSRRASRRERSYQELARAIAKGTGYTYGPGCESCDAAGICDGLHRDYAALFGSEEVRPIKLGYVATDPTLYIRRQRKVVDPATEH